MIATKQWKDEILLRLSSLVTDSGKISLTLAHEIIEGCAWWEGHPSGPVRARGHAKNIQGQNGSWRLDFGANSFLISTAVLRSCNRIRAWLSKRNGEILSTDWAELHSSIASALRCSVSNHSGDEYDYYSAGTEDKIIFGVQAISINGFVLVLGSKLKLSEMYTFKYPPIRRSQTLAPVNHNRNTLNSCPWCNALLSLKNKKKHLSRCPKKPQSKTTEPSNSSHSPSIINTQGTSLTELQNSPVLVKCPWCAANVLQKNLQKHMRARCPKNPQKNSK